MLKLPSIFRSIRFLFVGLLLLGGLHGFSQTPVAAFTANRVSGCAPLSVAFTDQSTGDPKFWNWDLGNGTLSNQQNPVVVYSTPGTYTVSLVVRNSNGADAITKTAYITVNPSPTAMFTANITTACLGSTIQFTDQSSTPDGSIQSWLWNFGDGTTSTERNPSKTYPDNGFYNVSLTVTSSTGCTHTRSVARYIRILSGVTAEFFFRQDSVCRAPFPVHFSNQTSGPGSMTYIWDMGNGSTATTEDATTSYNAEGTYTVQLIARSEYGCADTITKTVPVTGANAVITAPSSGCINQPVNFVNGSTPTAVSSYWDFGDGTTGSGANISKTFNQAGVYEVKLVTDLGFCKDSTIHNLTIPDLPAVNFTGTNLTGCKGPLTADFQPQAPEAVSWFWDFGDGQTSTLQAPSNVYNNPGVYDVRLTITNANGCTNTILKTAFAEIRSPEVTIPNSSPGGCAPFSFTTSANVNAIDGVSSWSWTFGEGATPITSQN
ncbi:MAG TPA: PKD domain-containing protein, partial [Parasegetibacter sp.]